MANKRLSENKADEKLAHSVSKTLDKSLIEIDDLNLQRLKNARASALEHSRENVFRSSRKWISLSVAASLAAFLLIPVVAHQHLFNLSGEQDLEVLAQDVPYSAEEMDDIEMLMALEGSDA